MGAVRHGGPQVTHLSLLLLLADATFIAAGSTRTSTQHTRTLIQRASLRMRAGEKGRCGIPSPSVPRRMSVRDSCSGLLTPVLRAMSPRAGSGTGVRVAAERDRDSSETSRRKVAQTAAVAALSSVLDTRGLRTKADPRQGGDREGLTAH